MCIYFDDIFDVFLEIWPKLGRFQGFAACLAILGMERSVESLACGMPRPELGLTVGIRAFKLHASGI